MKLIAANIKKVRYQIAGRTNLSVHLIFGAFIVFSACGVKERVKGLAAPASPSPAATQTQNEKKSISALAMLYRNAKTEAERRSLCLQAIDEKAFFETGPVSTVDEIFGTDFASKLPGKRDGTQPGIVYFADQPPVYRTSEGLIEQRGHVGWYLVVEYDYSGTIRNYFLTNLHK
jgi:hypothetical protein